MQKTFHQKQKLDNSNNTEETSSKDTRVPQQHAPKLATYSIHDHILKTSTTRQDLLFEKPLESANI